MSDWTKMMNQPEAKPTRQERINGVACLVKDQTHKTYSETADALEAKAEQVTTMVAKHAGLDSVTADEVRAAAAYLRQMAADGRYGV